MQINELTFLAEAGAGAPAETSTGVESVDTGSATHSRPAFSSPPPTYVSRNIHSFIHSIISSLPTNAKTHSLIHMTRKHTTIMLGSK